MSENYYKILGVSESDDDQTVKEAYRELVKKYHPDRYADSDLADIAEEKMKKINYAYDEILKMRKLNPRAENMSVKKKSQYRSGKSESISLKTVRELINQNKLSQAEIILIKLEKNAEWHYLTGLIYLKRGLYSKAKNEIEKSVSMKPDNAEYRKALDNFAERAGDYKAQSAQKQKAGVNAKDCFASVCPIDFCIEF